MVQAIVGLGPPCVVSIDLGGDALLRAAEEGDLSLMRTLLERGVAARHVEH